MAGSPQPAEPWETGSPVNWASCSPGSPPPSELAGSCRAELLRRGAPCQGASRGARQERARWAGKEPGAFPTEREFPGKRQPEFHGPESVSARADLIDKLSQKVSGSELTPGLRTATWSGGFQAI